MNERGTRRGAGAPFYAPLRRKTSAEIISEARAAIYGEMSGTSSGSGGGVGGALRPLRTRRPYTPREPQRALFTDRARTKDNRPPSAFDLKYMSLSESSEETLETMQARIATLDEEALDDVLAETQNTKKKPLVRNQTRSNPTPGERSGDGWGGFTKLPHLSGRSKPLHRRNTTGNASTDEPKLEVELAQAISVTRRLGAIVDDIGKGSVDPHNSKSLSPERGTKRRQFAGSKSMSCEGDNGSFGDIAVKHLAVQLPNTSGDYFDNMSVLELAEALSQPTRDLERVVCLLEALVRVLQTNNPTGSLREMTLRSLYSHVDCEDARILVAVARAMLTMRVTGPHLAAACKLVFKIAKNDKNDNFFKNTNLIELLVEGAGRAEPVTEASCCVFACGALRVLALEPALGARAHAAGAAHLAALHLKILNNAKAESPRLVGDSCTHALYQVTGALRSLAGGAGGTTAHAREFISSGALHELTAALALHTDRDVLTNVARCLSVLSADEACCGWLCSSPSSARALLRALAACAARSPLTVRLAYTLGNMAAADERARINIYNEEGGVDVLLTILETYTKRCHHETRDQDSDPDLHLVDTDLGGSDGSNEDVLIKTVRVIANLCLAERAGRGLAATYAERTMKALLACLELAEIPVADQGLAEEERASVAERSEELATAALATLNNITFYRDPPEPPDPLEDSLDKICQATCRWVGGADAAACEAVRALGNMSRCARAAHVIVLDGALDRLPPFLEHEEGAVRCAAAGVLVNVCGAGRAGAGAGAALAARALRAAAARADAPAAALLARALWNAHAHAPAPLPPAHAHRVATALDKFIDDESVFAACEASRLRDRRASEPSIHKHHVQFDTGNNNYKGACDNIHCEPKVNLYNGEVSGECDDEADGDVTAWSGEDLGFEDGDMVEEECECAPCKRLAAWEELVGVAIPLMEKLRPPRADASVGTD